MRVRFTPSARAQLLAAVDALRRENPTAARRFRKKVEHDLKRLSNFPNSGPVVAEFPDLPYREVDIAPYRFFYRIKGQTVWIVAI